MIFWNTKNSIEPKHNFYSEIKAYYHGVSDNQIPIDLLNQIIAKVTDEIYGRYKRSWKKYPKSRKRYSKLKLEDIEGSFIHYDITDFLIKKELLEYRAYSKILFKMNDEEFEEYEKRKHWYDTK